MSESKLHFGWRIEANAEAWYRRRYPHALLLERGFRARTGEIDLIFEIPSETDGKLELVFVEVRARLPGSWQSGIESVGPRKQARLARTIRVFLSRYRGPAQGVRLDLLGWDGTGWEHLPDLRPELRPGRD